MGILAILAIVLVIAAWGSLFENLAADESMVIQDPVDGELHVYTTPGLKYQNLGTVTKYKRVFPYWFSNADDQGSALDQSIKIRFQDGSHATISGMFLLNMPLADEEIIKIHKAFGSQAALEQELIRTSIEKCVYMTGPLMSAKESYSEKRSYLLNLIEDQLENGVYRTTSQDRKTTDPMTNETRTLQVVEIISDPNSPGGKSRQEISPIHNFSIGTSNLTINDVSYDDRVELQIEEQQKAIMAVQTAIARAKESEQEAYTVEQKGKATAMQAKWEQETIKAQKVTEAEMRRDVSKLEKEAAEFTKQKEILLGQGEAQRKQLVMSADGALDKKLEAWVEVNKIYADAISKYQGNWVPQIVMAGKDGSGNIAGGGAQQLIDMLSAKTAQDLSLSLKLPTGGNK